MSISDSTPTDHESQDLPCAVVFLPKSHKFKDLTGQVFGRLTVVAYSGANKFRNSRWLCRCSCGVEVIVAGGCLAKGSTQSCGCQQRELAAQRSKTHGLTRTTEYRRWCGMKTRCSNPQRDHYERYGGRGIKVCDRWSDSFEAFLADMGPIPSPKHEIDRIDNDGNYEPGNCRWATQIANRRNTTGNHLVTLDGVTLCLVEWAETIGIKIGTVRARLGRGWTPERALTTPVRQLGRESK